MRDDEGSPQLFFAGNIWYMKRSAGRPGSACAVTLMQASGDPGGARRLTDSTPCGVGGIDRDAIRGRRAQKACPCPRLLNVNPFGVPIPQLREDGAETSATCDAPLQEPPTEPPALRGESGFYRRGFPGVESPAQECVAIWTTRETWSSEWPGPEVALRETHARGGALD